MKKLLQNKKYEIIEHTADTGLKVWGKNFNELLRNAACGMYHLICEKNVIEKKIQELVSIKNFPKADFETLLITFLNELLYKTAIKKLVFKDFKIVIKNGSKKGFVINAFCFGERYSFKKHGRFLELKAATYHCLKVCKRNNLLYTKIFFDV